jgi:mRNA interferase RelE/StbE
VKSATVFRPDAREQLRKIDRPTAMTILRKLGELEKDPYAFGTTELVSRPGVRRLGVRTYRVFYIVDGEKVVIVVVSVAHRSVAYD